MQGMWYTKGGVRPEAKGIARLKEFSRGLLKNSDELFCALQEYEHEQLQQAMNVQPADTIKIKLNNTDIPDCHFPNQIVHTHIRSAESILDFILCATDTRVQLLATPRSNIKITFITCATDQMCAKYFKRRGCIQKLDNQLFIVPPQLEHKFTSCIIECPMDQEFQLQTIGFEEFIKRFETQQIAESGTLLIQIF
ncbi:hypothetical protein BH09DEP1_BH09DEP1_3870 [soil metagenome]